MTARREWWRLGLITGGFLLAYNLPSELRGLDNALGEALLLVRWYAREHVLLCLVPALFIAGAISVFVNQASVMRFLGAGAPRATAYGVASVSGTILAVCSCTVLPLFAGIYRLGAGLGPASAFLYAGPAINVLAIVLTARILGVELGLARAVGAVVFSVLVGMGMQLAFRRAERAQRQAQAALPPPPAGRPLWQTGLLFLALILLLVSATWSSGGATVGFWARVFAVKWPLTSVSAALLALVLGCWFGWRWRALASVAVVPAVMALLPGEHPQLAFGTTVLAFAIAAALQPGEPRQWLDASWTLARQILPLLGAGVLVAGLLLGRPGHAGLIPASWISRAVGGDTALASLFASVAGALMYFATLTEVPILQGLLGSGMGQGPALALLLAGPAVSLPSILVLRSIMGWRRTGTFLALVVIMATVTGTIYGVWS